MAFNGDRACAGKVWTLLTDSAVTAIRVQNKSVQSIMLQATFGAVPPTVFDGSVMLFGKQTLAADLTLAQLWPGVTGADRVYAYVDNPVALSVSHA